MPTKYQFKDEPLDMSLTAEGDIHDFLPRQAPPPDPGLTERFGGPGGLAAMGTRALTGVASAPGFLPGAITAGLGELGAEALEGSLFKQPLGTTIKRVGAEAGLGYVPFGKVLKAGKPLQSLMRGGAFAGGGEALREYTSTGDVDLQRAAEAGLFGGALTGGLSGLMKLFGRAGKIPAAPPVAKSSQEAARDIVATRTRAFTPGVNKELERAQERFEVAASRKKMRAIAEEDAAVVRAAKEQARLAKAAEKTALEQARQGEILEAIKGAELKPSKVGYRETVSAPAQEGLGKGTLSTAWKAPKEPGTAEAAPLDELKAMFGVRPLGDIPGLGPRAAPIPGPDLMSQVKAASAPKPSFEMGGVTHVLGPTGSHVVPSKPPRPASWDAYPPEVVEELDKLGTQLRALPHSAERRAIGKQMSEIRDFFTPGKMRESWRGTVRTKGPEGPEQFTTPAAAPPTAGPWIDEELERIKRFTGEAGAIDPALLTRLGLGAGGALIGGATDPLDDPMLSAMAGGAVGLAAPSAFSALQKLGAPKEVLAAAPQTPDTPRGIMESVKKVFGTLPSVQRFNYLASTHGLAANALVGPWGSAVMGALEAGLSGDARGWAALRQLSPTKFLMEYSKALPEASVLTGRAEGAFSRAEMPGFKTQPSHFELATSTPGILLTAGDVAARRILQAAGFGEKQARMITLTSEPELTAMKGIADFGKQKVTGSTSKLVQFLFPFRRTPANIIEQGSMRIPVLGSFVQSYRGTPDPRALQALQQGLGAATGGVGFGIGANVDPETARTTRRYLSNVAGRYSLPTTMGFVAGQAYQQGKSPWAGAALGATQAFPLPSTEPIADWGRYVGSGGPFGEAPIPRGAIPSEFRQPETSNLLGLLSPKTAPTTPATLSNEDLQDLMRKL